MCIANRLSKKEVEEYKKGLPEEFTAYRCVARWGANEPLFREQNSNEPNTTEPGIHEAGNYPQRRSSIEYTPGFHVFKTEEEAMEYLACGVAFFRAIAPVTVRKEWVQEVGNAQITYKGRKLAILSGVVFVCSHIKVEEA